MTELSRVVCTLLQGNHNKLSDQQSSLIKCLVVALSWSKTDNTVPSTMPVGSHAPNTSEWHGEKTGKQIAQSNEVDTSEAVVRFTARQLMTELVQSDDQWATKILNVFATYLDCSKIDISALDFSSTINCSAAGIQHALFSLFKALAGSGDKVKVGVALAALPVCYSPYLLRERSGVWPALCLASGLTAAKVIKQNKASVVEMMTTKYTPTVTNSKVIVILQ